MGEIACGRKRRDSLREAESLIPIALDTSLTHSISVKKTLSNAGLRSFVAIVDAGSMLKAAERECVTQSALSLRIARLEDVLQRKLFSRAGGRLVLTPAGETILEFARSILDLNDRALSALSAEASSGPVRIGLVQDVADDLLSQVIARFAQLYPNALLQVSVGGTGRLMQQFDADALDIVVGIGAADDPRAIRRGATRWLGSRDLLDRETIPLAMLEPPCSFREAGLAALRDMNRSYRIVLEAPSMSALRAGVDAGLAITCRTDLFRSWGAEVLDSPDMPALPDVSCILAKKPDSTRAVRNLSEIVCEALLH